MDYHDVFRLESTSSAALIPQFCTAKMEGFFAGAGITWETDCGAYAYSLCPTGYVCGGSRLSITSGLLACACQVFGRVSIKNFQLATLYEAVICRALCGLGWSHWIEFTAKNIIAGIKLKFPSDELQDIHQKNKSEK